MTQDLAALVAKLRKGRLALLGHEIGQAADALEAQADENERLRNAIETLGVGLDHLGLITSPMKVAARAALQRKAGELGMAQERIWATWTEDFGAVQIGKWADSVRHEPLGIEYVRADVHDAEIARMTAALAEAEGAHWRVTPNTYTIPSEHPLGRTEADPMEGPGGTYRDAYQRVLAERDTARAETAKWQADANLMLGFADLAYDVGAMPSSSELIAARDRVLAARDKATRERALREAASSIEGNTQERIALRRAILAKIKEAENG